MDKLRKTGLCIQAILFMLVLGLFILEPNILKFVCLLICGTCPIITYNMR